MKFIGYLFIALVFYFSTNKIILLKSSKVNCYIKSDTSIINLNDSIKINNLYFLGLEEYTASEILYKISLNDSVKAKNFLLFGIVNHQTAEMLQFKEKYGVGFQFQTCVISPDSYKKTSQNNQNVAVYLSDKFDKTWLKDLPLSPLGIKK
mgnify:CR=1 FL=1